MRNRIENSKAFLGLDNLKKMIYKHRSKMLEIEHQFNLASNIGMEKWLELYKPDAFLKNIVSELLSQ